MFSVLNSGKIILKNASFQLPMIHPPSTIMITKWHGLELFYTILIPIRGFSIFTTIALIPFPYSFITGGHGLVVLLPFFPMRPNKAGTFGI